MIELIFLLFSLHQNMMVLDMVHPSPGEQRFCAQVQLATSFVETDEIYPVAEVKWADDESQLEGFYAFWENRDTCIPY